MISKSSFYFPVTLHRDSVMGTLVAPMITTLPLLQALTDEVVILQDDTGGRIQGMYAFDGISAWRFALPMQAVSAAIISGSAIDIYFNKINDVTLPIGTSVYKNGQLQSTVQITHGTSVYATMAEPTGLASVIDQGT